MHAWSARWCRDASVAHHLDRDVGSCIHAVVHAQLLAGANDLQPYACQYVCLVALLMMLKGCFLRGWPPQLHAGADDLRPRLCEQHHLWRSGGERLVLVPLQPEHRRLLGKGAQQSPGSPLRMPPCSCRHRMCGAMLALVCMPICFCRHPQVQSSPSPSLMISWPSRHRNSSAWQHACRCRLRCKLSLALLQMTVA